MKYQQPLQTGFTLIEVLVALVIVAVAVPAYMLAISNEASNLSHVEQKTLAQWVASNKLTELQLQNRLSGAVPKGKADGDYTLAERKWRWTSEVKEFEQELMKGIFAVEIKVFDDETNAQSSIITGEVSPLVTHYGMMFDRNANIPNLATICASQSGASLPFCHPKALPNLVSGGG